MRTSVLEQLFAVIGMQASGGGSVIIAFANPLREGGHNIPARSESVFFEVLPNFFHLFF